MVAALTEGFDGPLLNGFEQSIVALISPILLHVKLPIRWSVAPRIVVSYSCFETIQKNSVFSKMSSKVSGWLFR